MIFVWRDVLVSGSRSEGVCDPTSRNIRIDSDRVAKQHKPNCTDVGAAGHHNLKLACKCDLALASHTPMNHGLGLMPEIIPGYLAVF